MFFAKVLATLFIAPTAWAAPHASSVTLEPRQSTPNSQGTHDGYFYYWWSDRESPSANYTNGPGGSYSLSWTAPGNLFGGKGWKQGARRNITYSADWEPVNNGNSYLSIYGVARNPGQIVEYFIMEAHGSFNPGTSAQPKGFVTVDGAVYNLYYGTYEAPGVGLKNIRYYAIRQEMRTSGTVDTGIFFDAWADAGMPMQRLDVQIVSTEANSSAGQSYVKVLTPP